MSEPDAIDAILDAILSDESPMDEDGWKNAMECSVAIERGRAQVAVTAVMDAHISGVKQIMGHGHVMVPLPVVLQAYEEIREAVIQAIRKPAP